MGEPLKNIGQSLDLKYIIKKNILEKKCFSRASPFSVVVQGHYSLKSNKIRVCRAHRMTNRLGIALSLLYTSILEKWTAHYAVASEAHSACSRKPLARAPHIIGSLYKHGDASYQLRGRGYVVRF